MAYKYYKLSCGKLAESASIVTGRPIVGISAANPRSFIIRASSMPDFTKVNLVFRKQIKLLNCDRIFAVKLLSEDQIRDQFSNDDVEKMPVYDEYCAEYFGQNLKAEYYIYRK